MCEVKDTINIAFICDDNYALCTGVAIYSLYINRNKSREYSINILCYDVSQENIDLFLELSNEGFIVNAIDISKRSINYSNFSRSKFVTHVSTTALYKFNIPELFPNLDKILYLDGDLLIRDGLEELYDIELKSCYASVCKDVGAEIYPSQYNERLNTSHSSYFNSGVMLLNLKLFREDDISKKLIDYKKNGINHFMDQDAFNIVLNENVIYFDFSYNMILSCWLNTEYERIITYYDMDSNLKSVEEIFNKAKIIHFSAAKCKPWNYRTNILDFEWISYYFESPFKKNSINRVPTTFDRDFDLFSIIENINYKKRIISVIIPVYNSARYLVSCIESLITQTLYACEFIFVNDGSTDESLEILKYYAKKDSRIIIIDQENQGAGASRNNGLKNATGEFVAFLDSDDIMVDNALEMMLRKIIQTDADLVVSSAYTFSTNENEKKLSDWCIREKYFPIGETYSIDNCGNYLFQLASGVPWSRLFKLSFIKENNLFFPEIEKSEDLYFVFMSYALAKKIAILNRPTVLYRMILGNGSLEDAKDKHPTAILPCYRLIYEKLNELGIYYKVEQSFCNVFFNSYAYNLNTFKTGVAFEKLYSTIKDEFSFYRIDIEDMSYFYNKDQYLFMKKLYDSDNCLEFLYDVNKNSKIELSNRNKSLNKSNKLKYNSKSSNKIKGQLNWARTELDKVRTERLEYKKEVARVNGVKSTLSYKIGRFITFIPRKIRDMFIY